MLLEYSRAGGLYFMIFPSLKQGWNVREEKDPFSFKISAVYVILCLMVFWHEWLSGLKKCHSINCKKQYGQYREFHLVWDCQEETKNHPETSNSSDTKSNNLKTSSQQKFADKMKDKLKDKGCDWFELFKEIKMFLGNVSVATCRLVTSISPNIATEWIY